MMQEEDHIKRLFNEKLKGFEADVPDSLWSRIDASMSKNSETVLVRKQQSRSRIIKWTATAVSIAAMIALLFVLTDIDRSQDMSLKQLVESLPQDEVNPKIHQEIEKPIVEELYTQEIPVTTYRKRESSVEKNAASFPETNVEENMPFSVVDKAIESIVDVEEDSQVKTGKEREQAVAEYGKILTKGTEVSETDPSVVRRGSGFSLSLNSRSNFALLNTVETVNADGKSYLPQLFTKKEEVEFRHYQPIALGVSVSKEILEDLRAEVGVSYIYATSRVKAKPNDVFELDDRQVFHYLAVPVSISYHFAKINKLKLHFSVGGTVQKDFYGLVKGKLASVTGLENPLPAEKMTKKSELEQDNPQFSVNANFGASYPLYKKLHVYGKVGWAYYLDAENQYKTIYSDRPHQLDLNLGVRYDF